MGDYDVAEGFSNVVPQLKDSDVTWLSLEVVEALAEAGVADDSG